MPKPIVVTAASVSTDVEKIYKTLRKHQQNQQLLFKTLTSLQQTEIPSLVSSPLLHSRILSRCGPTISLSIPFLLFLSRSPSFSPSPSLSKSLTLLLSRSHSFQDSWNLIQFLRANVPSFVNGEMFVVMIRKFAKRRLVDKAVMVLDEMRGFGCEPDEYVFGCLMDALAKNGAVKEASRVFEEMKDTFPPKLRYDCQLTWAFQQVIDRLTGFCSAAFISRPSLYLILTFSSQDPSFHAPMVQYQLDSMGSVQIFGPNKSPAA